MNPSELYQCRHCLRLVDYLQQTQQDFPEYHCKPVAAFGEPGSRLLIVGLAPGKHGANASGRPFTGDASGDLLFKTLYLSGFASQSRSQHTKDRMKLIDCTITNAVKCLPPDNRPIAEEINNCNPYLMDEIAQLDNNAVILALGAVAHKAVLKALGLKLSSYPFAHAGEFPLKDGKTLVDSYHCSRYNTQTKRLTESMFSQLFQRIRQLLDG